MGEEVAEQTVRLEFERITTGEGGSHYLRIDASGIADFGPEGTSSARIEALYDLREDAWLRVDYVLGPGAGLLQELDALAGRCPVDALFLQKKLPRLRGQGVRRSACDPLARAPTNARPTCSRDGRAGENGRRAFWERVIE